MHQVGIDIGGTFTDAVLLDDKGQVRVAKVPTTPGDLREGFFNAVRTVSESAEAEVRRIVHGTTVATNIMVQRNGARTGLITTKGFTDTIHIMQGHGYTVGIPDDEVTRIQELEKPAPIVPKRLIRGVTERVDSQGVVVVALDEDELRRHVRELVDEGVDSIAICFLWSFVNDSHERSARAIVHEIAPEVYVSISSEIAPRIGEYNRTVATAINAYVGPSTSRYIQDLQDEIDDAGSGTSLSILQSSGGVVAPHEAQESPVRLIGSGPVGGTIATKTLGARLGERNLICCDMGGTSFDVSVIADGEVVKQQLGIVDQYEYAVSTVEIQSIGSGGGSIVSVEGGTFRVGPKSAGSVPGPACYGRGGTLPTITDCNLIVGYLSEDHQLSGGLQLDLARAEEAVRVHVAEPLGMSVIEAAQGALEVVDIEMAELIRQITVGRGLDPRDFTVFAFGGAGPLHAPGFSGELGVKSVVIPEGPVASLWSAYGAISSDVLLPLESFHAARAPFDAAVLEKAFAELEGRGRESVEKMGVPSSDVEIQRFVDLRYGSQVHVMSVPVSEDLDDAAVEKILTDFDILYETRNGPGTGYREAGVEMTAIRIEVVGRVGTVAHDSTAEIEDREIDITGNPSRTVHWGGEIGSVSTPVVGPEQLAPGNCIVGPAIVELPTTTVPVRRGHRLRVDRTGSFIVSRVSAQ